MNDAEKEALNELRTEVENLQMAMERLDHHPPTEDVGDESHEALSYCDLGSTIEERLVQYGVLPAKESDHAPVRTYDGLNEQLHANSMRVEAANFKARLSSNGTYSCKARVDSRSRHRTRYATLEVVCVDAVTDARLFSFYVCKRKRIGPKKKQDVETNGRSDDLRDNWSAMSRSIRVALISEDS